MGMATDSESSSDGLYDTGGERKAGRASSVVSSRNSSLRGDDNFETDYQRSRPRRGSSASGALYPIERDIELFPAMPPEKESNIYHCDVCNRDLCIMRMRNWQYVSRHDPFHSRINSLTTARRHILSDVEPYMCLEVNCKAADATYGSIKALRGHYRACHPHSHIIESASPMECLFCEDVLPQPGRLLHMARHMEEVAFSAMPQVREQWAFYSESSDSSSEESGTFERVRSLLRHGPITWRRAGSALWVSTFGYSGPTLYQTPDDSCAASGDQGDREDFSYCCVNPDASGYLLCLAPFNTLNALTCHQQLLHDKRSHFAMVRCSLCAWSSTFLDTFTINETVKAHLRRSSHRRAQSPRPGRHIGSGRRYGFRQRKGAK